MSKNQDIQDFALPATDIVFSCTICQDTLSNIYAEGDQNRGLRKGVEPHDGRITKLWLTECAHLTCGKHLDGGGVSFYPEQQIPRAPCPLCSTVKNDRSEKALFFINGTSKGEYDSNIPETYFQMPPAKLSGDGVESEALRFQYLSLVRFASKTYEKTLHSSNALQWWEDRKADIVESLGHVTILRDELLSAGSKLMASHHDVSTIERTLNSVGATLGQNLSCHGVDEHQTASKDPVDVGSRLAQGSAADLDGLNRVNGTLGGYRSPPGNHTISRESPSAKRKRGRSGSEVEQELNHILGGRPYQKTQSRELMPPPSLPLHKPYIRQDEIPNIDSPSKRPLIVQSEGPQSPKDYGMPRLQTSQSDLNYTSTAPFSRTTLTPGPPSRSEPGRVRDEPQDLGNYANIAPQDLRSHRYDQPSPVPPRSVGALTPFRSQLQLQNRAMDHSTPRFLGNSGSRVNNESMPASSENIYLRRPDTNTTESFVSSLKMADRTTDPDLRPRWSGKRDDLSPYSQRPEISFDHQQNGLVQKYLPTPSRSGSHQTPKAERRLTLTPNISSASKYFTHHGLGLSGNARSSNSYQTKASPAHTGAHRQRLMDATHYQDGVGTNHDFFSRETSNNATAPYVHGQNPVMATPSKPLRSRLSTINGQMRTYSSTNENTPRQASHWSRPAPTSQSPFFDRRHPSGSERSKAPQIYQESPAIRRRANR